MYYQAEMQDFKRIIGHNRALYSANSAIYSPICTANSAYDAPLVAHLAAHHTPLSSPQMRGFLQKGRQKVAD